MKKKQRMKYDIAKICRANLLGAGRTDALKALVYARYNLSFLQPGGIRAVAMGYTGADYWV